MKKALEVFGLGGDDVGTVETRTPAKAGRSLDDPESLRGATPEEVKRLAPSNFEESPTKKGDGIRLADPERKGEQIRIMPGNPNDPNPTKQGPYVRISKNGKVSPPIPLQGNPTVR
jgi:hypothetical protein